MFALGAVVVVGGDNRQLVGGISKVDVDATMKEYAVKLGLEKVIQELRTHENKVYK